MGKTTIDHKSQIKNVISVFNRRKGVFMSEIYLVGDCHGDFVSDNGYPKIQKFIERHKPSKDAIFIVLGDHGLTYWSDTKRNNKAMAKVNALGYRFVFIYGNHDRRHSAYFDTEPVHVNNDALEGWFYVNHEYDNLFFAIDYGYYSIGTMRAFVAGGAWSVDGDYRKEMWDLGYHNYRWFYDEQLSKEERAEAMKQFLSRPLDDKTVILSHTCPSDYIPVDAFLPGIDQSKTDRSMETFLNELNYLAPQCRVYCGHWHIDRHIGNVRFLFHDIVQLE